MVVLVIAANAPDLAMRFHLSPAQLNVLPGALAYPLASMLPFAAPSIVWPLLQVIEANILINSV